MATYRENLRALCAGEHAPSKKDVANVLRGVGTEELLDFLIEEGEKLLAMVSEIPLSILDGLEQKMSSDTSSKNEAELLMARLLAKR